MYGTCMVQYTYDPDKIKDYYHLVNIYMIKKKTKGKLSRQPPIILRGDNVGTLDWLYSIICELFFSIFVNEPFFGVNYLPKKSVMYVCAGELV